MLQKFLVVAMLGLAATGCSNDCDDAADKIEECLGSDAGSKGDTDDCSGVAECIAKCTNDASCGEIKAFFSAATTDNAYAKCMEKC